MKKHQNNRTGVRVPYALRVSHRKTVIDKLNDRRRHTDHVLIQCGCCDERIAIWPQKGAVEIGGVFGAVEEWRAILLPLLGVDGYERYPDIDKAIDDCAAGRKTHSDKMARRKTK